MPKTQDREPSIIQNPRIWNHARIPENRLSSSQIIPLSLLPGLSQTTAAPHLPFAVSHLSSSMISLQEQTTVLSLTDTSLILSRTDYCLPQLIWDAWLWYFTDHRCSSTKNCPFTDWQLLSNCLTANVPQSYPNVLRLRSAKWSWWSYEAEKTGENSGCMWETWVSCRRNLRSIWGRGGCLKGEVRWVVTSPVLAEKTHTPYKQGARERNLDRWQKEWETCTRRDGPGLWYEMLESAIPASTGGLATAWRRR